MRSFDLDSLEIFTTVVQEGGIVRAAEKLNRVQSNVTTRVKQLETRLGLTLFERRGRTLVLTEAGQTFFAHAERLLTLAADIEYAMKNTWIHGPIRLGTMESTLITRLVPKLTQFHDLHPDIPLKVTSGATDDLVRQVRDHRLDAAFVGDPCAIVGLESKEIFFEDLVVITQKDHRDIATAQDLTSSSILAFEEGCAYRKVLETWFSESDAIIEKVVEIGSYQSMIAWVAAGSGCGIVPKEVLNTTLASQDIRTHILPEKFSANRTRLVWDTDNGEKLRPLLDLFSSD
ncbi:MAG: LysR family transcriptional regulator [Cohaesibacter sp.]|jgi:DNA-binding transcriptional LysR family regulator|nr:LysR family transcriptional regulator [Cohaesibacter sp.]